jgi:hypothetical protein
MRDLYDELARAFPQDWGAGSPLGEYCDQFRNDFEGTFTEVVLGITEEYGLPGPSLTTLEDQRLLALYFSRFVLDLTGMDYYSKLLEVLRRSGNIPHTVFGSLNYECLFEQAAHNLGLDVDYYGGYGNDTVHVAKLHGACNFIGAAGQIGKAQLAGTAVQLEVRPIILPVGVGNLEKAVAEKFSSWENTYLPIMSQVSYDKVLLLTPGKIHQMRNAWNARVREAKFVAIIGVSFNPYDHHITEPIKDASGTVLYIGDEASFTKWHAVNRRTEHIERRLEGGFAALLTRLGVAEGGG